MNSQIQMSINENGFLNNLGSIFTSSKKVLNELCQNAARANATRITFELETENDQHCLYISDNGCGIQDWQKLLTIADTGWTGDTLKANPYGMGFLSAIFGCDTIEVISKGKMFKATREEIIGRMPIDIVDTDSYDGTIIVMRGINAELHDYVRITRQSYFGETSIRLLGLGYDIEIELSLNGESSLLSQSHSITLLEQQPNLIKHQFEHGVIYFNPKKKDTQFKAYLQGALILEQFGSHHIVHLNESTPARMPDRENLLEEQSIKDAINNELVSLIRNELLEDIEEFDSLDSMVQTCIFEIAKKYCPSLLNDLDYVDTSIVTSSSEYTLGRREIDSGNHFSNVVSRETLEEATALFEIPAIDDLDPNDKIVYLMNQSNVYFVNTSGLESNHWIHSMNVQPLASLEVSHTINASSTSADFSGHYDFEVLVCDDFKLAGPLGTVTVNNCAIVIESETPFTPLIVIPKHESAESALAMLGDFKCEHGVYQETEFEHDEDKLIFLLCQLTTSSTTELLEQAIKQAFNSESMRTLLDAGTYSIAIDGSGVISVSQ
ncbi:sensor histidine kinase [Vibrio sp. SCSIO 43140]|uniref:ATP-binding protein n=1 Tax=Vibrio sp. SCSIO 43140 TaxID=2819100 RepID=UPI0020757E34|nr:ATP-binding protein [Vibrio sp. SCSIO 43140]USD59050.1 sensor histidine kinase [Vibrio sp. SCSIO 43140]